MYVLLKLKLEKGNSATMVVKPPEDEVIKDEMIKDMTGASDTIYKLLENYPTEAEVEEFSKTQF